MARSLLCHNGDGSSNRPVPGNGYDSKPFEAGQSQRFKGLIHRSCSVLIC